MYNKLLIESGGGIIATSQMAKQDNAVTINIGLGGTGIDCLKMLKKEVYSRLCPDNGANSVVPEYKHIKFLAVDTDKSSLDSTKELNTINDTNDEFFDISSSDIHKFLSDITKNKANYPEYSWLCTRDIKTNSQGLRIKSAEAGAGGVRQAGRILLIQKSSQFVTKLETLINSACKDMTEPSININIFTGIGGGTGAGTFLDVCYLVRYVLSNNNFSKIPMVSGFFFLPDVNLQKKPDITYVMSNGFASMKDLDYCMNFENNGGEWNQLYHGFSYKTKEAPVDMAYLISAENSKGGNKSNGYQYAMHVAVNAVLEFITKPYIPTGAVDGEGENVFSVNSHISNFERIVSEVEKKSKEHGGLYRYCALGGSNAYLPYKDIMTYLASKIFVAFSYVEKTLPIENDIENFVGSNNLSFTNIYSSIKNNISAITKYNVDKELLKDQLPSITSADEFPNVLKKIVEAKKTVQGEYERNMKALTESVENSNLQNTSSIISLISRINKAVKDLAKNPKYGPYFAAGILHSVNTVDLQNIIDGYIDENNRLLQMARSTCDLRREEVEAALSKVRAKNKPKYRDEYVDSFYAYQIQQATVTSYEKMGDVLSTLKVQVEDLYNDYYNPFLVVFNNLSETFDANLNKLSKPINVYTSFSKPIISLNDKDKKLREALDSTVENMKIPDIMNHFIECLLDNDEQWLKNNEDELCATVKNFFLNELSSFADKSITYYLKLKYGFKPDDKNVGPLLTQKIYEDIIVSVYGNSTPLFTSNSTVFKMENAAKMGYCSVPEISTEIKAAAQELIDTRDVSLTRRILETQNEISVFQYICGVPLAAYNNASIYYDKYKNDRESGKHLYEGVDGGPDFRNLPNLVPFSTIPDSMLTNELNENSNEFDRAVKNGVIVYNYLDKDETIVDSCIINMFDEENVDKDIEAINSIVNTGNSAKIENALENLKDQKLPEIVDTRFIVNDGCANHQEVVCKDNALNSPYLCEIIKKENSILDKYISAIENLKKAREANDPQVYKKFAQALCCNVIFKESTFNYKYKTETGVFAEDIELTSRKTEPYGEDMPLYSAFYNYKGLPNEVKDDIDKAVNEVLDNDDTYVSVYKENREVIKQFVLEQGKEDIDVARKLYANNAKEIQTALEQIYNLI